MKSLNIDADIDTDIIIYRCGKKKTKPLKLSAGYLGLHLYISEGHVE